jgi:hypothetical protein
MSDKESTPTFPKHGIIYSHNFGCYYHVATVEECHTIKNVSLVSENDGVLEERKIDLNRTPRETDEIFIRYNDWIWDFIQKQDSIGNISKSYKEGGKLFVCLKTPQRFQITFSDTDTDMISQQTILHENVTCIIAVIGPVRPDIAYFKQKIVYKLSPAWLTRRGYDDDPVWG